MWVPVLAIVQIRRMPRVDNAGSASARNNPWPALTALEKVEA
jgi:hypothetical protein